MKKSILFLAAAASILAVVSCGDTSNQDATNVLTQQQQDSILNARLDEEKARITDSINNENLRIADSIRVADSLLNAGKDLGKKVVTQTAPPKKTTPSKVNTPKQDATSTSTAPVNVNTKSAQDEKMQSRQSQGRTITEEKKNEQDEKMKNR